MDSTKKQLDVISQSSVEDTNIEMEEKIKSLQLDFDKRVMEKERDHEERVKRLVKEYETEKMKIEEKHQVVIMQRNALLRSLTTSLFFRIFLLGRKTGISPPTELFESNITGKWLLFRKSSPNAKRTWRS